MVARTASHPGGASADWNSAIMRWFVEISPFGQGSAPSVTMCVEAPQWQRALNDARASRGDTGGLGHFSIELLEEGYRAIDPLGRVRYTIQQAPDDAPLTGGEAAAAPAPIRRFAAAIPASGPCN